MWDTDSCPSQTSLRDLKKIPLLSIKGLQDKATVFPWIFYTVEMWLEAMRCCYNKCENELRRNGALLVFVIWYLPHRHSKCLCFL